MTIRISNPKDFWTGVIFLFFGAAAVWIARDYQFGTTFKMGPGYFPAVLGALLAFVGLLTALRGLLRPGEPLGTFVWRKLALVLVATTVFGVLLRGAGLLVAVFVLVMIGAMASRYFRFWPTLMLGAGASAFCVLVFIKALGMPIPMLGAWLGY